MRLKRWTPALTQTLNREQDKTVTSVAEAAKGISALNLEVQVLGMEQGALDLALQKSNESTEAQLDAFAEGDKASIRLRVSARWHGRADGRGNGPNALNLLTAMREHNKAQAVAAAARQ